MKLTKKEQKEDRIVIENFLSSMFQPGEVTELRVLKYRSDDSGRTENLSGYYDRFDLIAKDAVRFSGNAYGVYFTINPLKPKILDRYPNRKNQLFGSKKNESAHDKDVLLRRWLVIDVDTIRVNKEESASKDEKILTWDNVEHKVIPFLEDHCGIPDPIVDSGNGYHLYYRLIEDYPIDDLQPTGRASTIHLVLEILSKKFPEVTIDTTVSNLSRIMRLPYTYACKGKNTPMRPWRKSRILAYVRL